MLHCFPLLLCLSTSDEENAFPFEACMASCSRLVHMYDEFTCMTSWQHVMNSGSDIALLVRSTPKYTELIWSHYFSKPWHQLTVNPSVCYEAHFIPLECLCPSGLWVPHLLPVLYMLTLAMTHSDRDYFNHWIGPSSSKSNDVKPDRFRTQC